MRITPNITSQNSLYNIQRARTLLDSINEKISSGNNYNRPSDDPVATRLLTGMADRMRASDQYQSNITKANVWLNVTNTAITGMSATMKEVKSLVSTISSGVTDMTVRDNAVSQLQVLKQQLVDMGNTQLNGVYIFNGTAGTGTVPFNGTTYNGNDTDMQVEVDANSVQAMNITGGILLKGTNAAPHTYGSVDILQTFDDLISTLTTNPSDVAAIQAAANNFEDGANQINSAQVDLSIRLDRLDVMKSIHTNQKNAMQTVVSNVQTADYAKLAVELQQQQTAFQATLSATARISQLSLLDYL